MTRRQRRFRWSAIAAIAALALASLNCEALDFLSTGGPMPVDEAATIAHIRETRVALGLTQIAVNATLTARAEEEPALPVEPPPAEEAPAAPGTSHVPAVIDVDFPAIIPADGSQHPGTIWFRDAGQDVILVRVEVTEGDMHGGSWDPTGEARWSGDEASTSVQAHCSSTKPVRAVITLEDAAGNVSEGFGWAFLCQ